MESSPTAAGAFFNRSTGGPAVLGRKGGGHGGTVLYQDVPGGIGDLRAGWTAGGIRGRRGVGGTDDVGEGGRRGRARVRVQKAVKVSGCTGGSDNGGRLGDIARRRERPLITSVPLPPFYE